MCHVSPDNIPMLTAFGWLFFGGGVVSILTGRSYFRGVIVRDQDPFGFWSATFALLLVGGMCLYGLAVCPRV